MSESYDNNSPYYILDGHVPVPVDSVRVWGQWMEKNRASRRVVQDFVGAVEVSTVFLGFEHGFMNGKPVVFETMVFGGKLDGECERCCTWEEAEEQHGRIVAKVKEEEEKSNGIQGE